MNVGILVTARLKSNRLPKKVLKSISGRPLIVHLLDRLKLAKRPNKIIICTSTLSQDDPLERIAKKQSVFCFRGHPDDVLLRLTEAAEQFEVDTVISCTADNPFVDPIYIDLLADFHIEQGNDFSKMEGLPWGAFAYALSYSAMLRACQIKANTDTEVWGGYFTESSIFKIGYLKVEDKQLRRPDLRLTVDTPEDFELVSKIFDYLYDGKRVFSLKEIIRLLDSHPELVSINKDIAQKTPIPIRFKPRDQWCLSESFNQRQRL